MIAIVSSDSRERVAFAVICEAEQWPFFECDSVRKLKSEAFRKKPKVLIVRHKLVDGYSDDVLAFLNDSKLRTNVRVIVIVAAGTPSGQEARQIRLGADVVQRDPLRTDIICAYMERFRAVASQRASLSSVKSEQLLSFAGAKINLLERTLHYLGKSVGLTPKEAEFVRLLFETRDQVCTYDTLYSEILGRRFRGDTSNMRVLLGKLATSFESVGLKFRPNIEVIPKTGYRYRAPSGLSGKLS